MSIGERQRVEILKVLMAGARVVILDEPTSVLAPQEVDALFAEIEELRRDMGDDWWPYGFAPNRHVLDTFLRYHFEQGLSKRRLQPEELFVPEALEAYKI